MGLNIRALLGLESSQFEKGIERNKQRVGHLGKQFGVLKGQIAAAFTVGFITRYIGGVVKAGAAITDMAERLGMSNRQVQRNQYALEQNGNTLDELSISFTALAKARERALAGDETALDWFSQLGITVKQLNDLDVENLFYAISRSVKNFAGNTNELRIAIMGALGETGMKLVKTMKRGIELLGDEIEGFGGIISDSDLEKMKQFDGLLAQISVRIRSFAVDSTVGGGIQNFLKGVGHFVVGAAKSGAEQITGMDFGSSKESSAAIAAFAKMYGDKKMDVTSINGRSRHDGGGPVMGTVPPILQEEEIVPVAKSKGIKQPSMEVNDSLVRVGNFLLGQKSMQDIAESQLEHLKSIDREIRNREKILGL